MPVNTARIASLCLPQAEIHVGLRLPDALELYDPRRPAALLYPGPGAVDVERSPPPTDITLVVVDGTWSQARKLIGLNPALAALPRYAFRPPRPSEYRIRKEPQAHYVSTLEALIHVLGVLEGDRDRFLPMLRPFRAMVEAQIAFATSSQSRRRIRHPRVRVAADPRDRLPPALRERLADLVCVHAEANAWPYGVVERATCPEELVQWVATRPATGESFEALVAPRHLLCSKTPWHLGIDVAEILRGMTPGELARTMGAVPATGRRRLRVGHASAGALRRGGRRPAGGASRSAPRRAFVFERVGRNDGRVPRSPRPRHSAALRDRAGGRAPRDALGHHVVLRVLTAARSIARRARKQGRRRGGK